ncbi:MAG: lytic transglycosylase domain-containing protein [Oxalobacter formigenes]|nr:lytic transglycosylase domain-containing protein [Oxalobacter formigenes]
MFKVFCRYLKGGLALVCGAMLLLPAKAAQDFSTTTAEDTLFLELRAAARKQDAPEAGRLAALLADYPAPSYVAYYRLKSRLEEAGEAEILRFIARYKGSAIADRLRNDWLLLLGKKGEWALFDREYPLFQLKDDFQLKCYYLISRALKGEEVAGEAKALLDTPKKNSEACQELVAVLMRTGQFSAEDVWFQARTAVQGSQAAAVKRLAFLAGALPEETARALDKPAVVLAEGPGGNMTSRQLFILALGRLAKKDPAQAAAILKENEEGLSLPERQAAWAQMALPAALALSPEALDFWKKAEGAPLSAYAQEWRARTALRAYDRAALGRWIDGMPERVRRDPAWVYWKGRVFLETGDEEAARRCFEEIAGQFHFYGQLAAEELGGRTVIPAMDRPEKAEVARMAANPGFGLALKFFAMNLRFEGSREWNWQLRGMNDRELLAAAEFARQQGVLDRMVNTSDRTKERFNFGQRFPMPFRDNLAAAAGEAGIEMTWVYGLIRQESRFVMNARSQAGASGLMQLMPATAKLVAKKIGLTDYRPAEINSMETNLLLGTNYLRMLMEQLDYSEVLATAGYNAGPRRPLAWRARLPETVEGAVFAETIPFTETRDYVKKVLSNAVYYAALETGRPQSLKQRLGEVSPP